LALAVNALVTGAHGFIGSHLVEGLLAAGHRVRAMVSPWGDLAHLRRVIDDVEVVRCDITAPAGLEAACAGIETVFHAAARVAEWGPWEPFHRTNVLGTEGVLRAAERAGARRLVLVSSVAVHRYRGYRDADPRPAPLDGDLTAYARSKVLAELMVGRARGVEPVIVRPGVWPFGPRDPTLPRLLRALRSGVFPLVGGGRSVLNTAFVDNLVDGLILAGTVPTAAERVYLVADDGMPTWREVLSELARVAGVAPRWLPLPAPLAVAAGVATEALWRVARPSHRPPIGRYAAALMRHDLHFTIRHARDELGYLPTVPWREGLRRSVAGLG
jgi:2-alkyl-3-oxoalkanoate reductase